MTAPQWTDGHDQPDGDPLPDGEHVDVDGILDAEDELHGPEEVPRKALTRAEKERAREEEHEETRRSWQAESMRELPPPDQPMAVARKLVADLFTDDGARFVHHWRGSWQRWHGPHWAEVDDSSVRAQVYSYTEDAWYEKLTMGIKVPALWAPNRRKIADLREALEAITHQPAAVAMPSWLEETGMEPAGEFVAMRTGLLHVATRRLIPHTPAFFNGISVPFDYDPDAPTPVRWLRFLDALDLEFADLYPERA